jgi:putative polyhydroxyalkanoate system protein
MSQLTMETSHNLGRDEAARRLKEKFGAVRQRYASHVNDLKETWVDHTLSFGFKAMGMGVTGTVYVEDASVRLDAQLPMAAMLFKGSIERQIRQELDGLLA